MNTKKNKPKKERSFAKGVLKLCVLCVSVVIALTLVSAQIELADKRKTLDKLMQQKESLMISNAEKKQLIEKSDQDEFVEKIAREYFGFAYPDEQIYIDISGS